MSSSVYVGWGPGFWLLRLSACSSYEMVFLSAFWSSIEFVYFCWKLLISLMYLSYCVLNYSIYWVRSSICFSLNSIVLRCWARISWWPSHCLVVDLAEPGLSKMLLCCEVLRSVNFDLSSCISSFNAVLAFVSSSFLRIFYSIYFFKAAYIFFKFLLLLVKRVKSASRLLYLASGT